MSIILVILLIIHNSLDTLFTQSYLLLSIPFVTFSLSMNPLFFSCNPPIFYLSIPTLFFKNLVLAAAPDNISFIISYYTVFTICVSMFSFSLLHGFLTITYTAIITFKIKNFLYYILFYPRIPSFSSKVPGFFITAVYISI